MSNILRRPMFRGGRVDSRGTGITSGLGYAGGGQIGGGTIYGNPMPDGRYGFANPQPANMALFLANQAKNPTGVSSIPTGSSLFESALSKVRSVPYVGRVAAPLLSLVGGTAASPYLAAAGTGIGLGSLADWYLASTSTPEAYIAEKKAYEENPMIGQETDLIVDEMGNTTTSYDALQDKLKKLNVGEKPGFFPRGGMTKYLADRGIDPATGRKPEPVVVAEDATKGDGTTGGTTDRTTGGTTNNVVSAETSDITLDDYIRMLGGDKARQRDIGDLLGRLSASALKRPGRGEERGIADVLGDFMTAEVAAGPGRREKIEQTAAMLDIKDKIESKRSRENIRQLMGMELFKQQVSAKNLAANITDAKKGEANTTKAILDGIQRTYPDRVPKVVKEGLPQVTEKNIGEIYVVEKTDPTNKTTSRFVVEIAKDASGNLIPKPLYTAQ
jgi:hypothetical protein